MEKVEMIVEKVIKKFKCKKDGYKVVIKNGKPKCIKMSPEEIRARKLAAKKAAMKRKTKSAEIIKKALKTKEKNKKMGIKKVIKKIG